MDYLIALRIMLPVYGPDDWPIKDPGLVKEVDAYRSTNYAASKHAHDRNNVTVRIYEGQYSGELFKVRDTYATSDL